MNTNTKYKGVASWIAIVLFSITVAGIVTLLVFIVRAPSAIRVHATTGVFSFSVPIEKSVAERFSWPIISTSEICSQTTDVGFTIVESRNPWNCSHLADSQSGTIWFDPGTLITILGYPDRTEIFLESESFSTPKVATIRSLDGSSLSLENPAKLVFNGDAEGSYYPIVLPVVSQDLGIGRATQWQTITNASVLQDGVVSLVRNSIIGDVLFSSEQIELLLGDYVVLVGKGSDYAQGILQLGNSQFIDVAITVDEGDALLHRLYREPIKLNAPLAIHLARDPMLVTFWAFITLLATGAVGLFNKLAPKKEN